MASPRQLTPPYPEIKPYNVTHVQVSALHSLYVAEYGNADGIPAVVCHGGPGAGSIPFFARYFDPKKYRIILYDQRGCGLSTPKFEMKENTTPHLIEDMEVIRKHLNIDKWVVQGGSWGVTLGLLYAEHYPERVLGLVLRGVFLGRKKDTYMPYKDDSPAALLHANEWADFKEKTVELLKKANLDTNLDDILKSYYLLLTQPDKEIQRQAAGTIAFWETLNIFLNRDIPPQEASDEDVSRGMAEVCYGYQGLFIQENQILANIASIAKIPTYIISGKYDLVCPPYQADELEKALDNVIRFKTVAGHSGSEPENISAIVESTDALAIKLQSQLQLAAKKVALSTSGMWPAVRRSAVEELKEVATVDSAALASPR